MAVLYSKAALAMHIGVMQSLTSHKAYSNLELKAHPNARERLTHEEKRNGSNRADFSST